ncbi:MAG: oligosaccharide flippase family protein, partial [Gammaproteobacteria bacterium]|nr:oligosaccharide flippase family protein [Gammaproteobacteria bacterium]
MGIARSTLRHSAVYSVANVIGKSASFIMLPFYAHYFDVEGYGIMAMLDTSVGVLSILLSGGLTRAIIRIYHEKNAELKSTTLATGLILTWFFASVMIILPMAFSVALSNFVLGTPEHYSLVCLALVTLLVQVTGQSASAFLVINQQSILYSAIDLLKMFIALGLNILLVIVLEV